LSRRQQRYRAGWTPAAELVRDATIVSTRFADPVTAIVVALDDPGTLDEGRYVSLDLVGATRPLDRNGDPVPPALVVSGNRSFLVYAVIPDEKAGAVEVGVARESGWKLAGVLGAQDTVSSVVDRLARLGLDAITRPYATGREGAVAIRWSGKIPKNARKAPAARERLLVKRCRNRRVHAATRSFPTARSRAAAARRRRLRDRGRPVDTGRALRALRQLPRTPSRDASALPPAAGPHPVDVPAVELRGRLRDGTAADRPAQANASLGALDGSGGSVARARRDRGRRGRAVRREEGGGLRDAGRDADRTERRRDRRAPDRHRVRREEDLPDEGRPAASYARARGRYP